MSAEFDQGHNLARQNLSDIEAAIVDYLGPPGSFSNLASIAVAAEGIHQPSNSLLMPQLREHKGFNGIMHSALGGDEQPAIGVVPLETAFTEAVPQVQDYIMSGDYVVLAEAVLLVNYVAASTGNRLDKIEKVYSYFKGHAATHEFTNRHNFIPDYSPTSTSDAAEKVAKKSRAAAALCSRAAAQLYGLNVLKLEPGEEVGHDQTTFMIIKARNGNVPSLESLRKYEDKDLVLVTGIVSPAKPTEESGLQDAMVYMTDGRDPVTGRRLISYRRRGVRNFQQHPVGGDADFLVTFKGPVDELYHKLEQEERSARHMRLKWLGVYPVAEQYQEPSDDQFMRMVAKELEETRAREKAKRQARSHRA